MWYDFLFSQLFISMLAIVSTFGLFICLMTLWRVKTWRAKALNALFSKRNYGILDVFGRAGNDSSYLVDFNNNTAELGSQAYILPKEVWRRDGLPYIGFSYIDGMEPLSMRRDTTEKVKDPHMIASALMEVKARAEAGALVQVVGLMRLLLILCVIGIVGVAIMSFLILNDVGGLKDLIAKSVTIIKG